MTEIIWSLEAVIFTLQLLIGKYTDPYISKKSNLHWSVSEPHKIMTHQ